MSAWRIYGSADALSSGFGRRCADRGRSREPLRLRAGHAWEIRHDCGRRACQKPRNYANNLRVFFVSMNVHGRGGDAGAYRLAG